MGAIKSKFRRSKSASRKGPVKTSSKKRKVSLPESQSARKTVDPRLPFSSYRQIFSTRNAWKAIMRSLETTARENLISFFRSYPQYREAEAFRDIKDVTGEEEMRTNERFEEIAVDILQLFDDVIANLESVDQAIDEIRRAASTTLFTSEVVKDMEETFIRTLRMTLGDERFTETTEQNFKLLYQFVQTELESHR